MCLQHRDRVSSRILTSSLNIRSQARNTLVTGLSSLNQYIVCTHLAQWMQHMFVILYPFHVRVGVFVPHPTLKPKRGKLAQVRGK